MPLNWSVHQIGSAHCIFFGRSAGETAEGVKDCRVPTLRRMDESPPTALGSFTADSVNGPDPPPSRLRSAKDNVEIRARDLRRDAKVQSLSRAEHQHVLVRPYVRAPLVSSAAMEAVDLEAIPACARNSKPDQRCAT